MTLPPSADIRFNLPLDCYRCVADFQANQSRDGFGPVADRHERPLTGIELGNRKAAIGQYPLPLRSGPKLFSTART